MERQSPTSKAAHKSPSPSKLTLANLQPPSLSNGTPLASPRSEARTISAGTSPSVSHRSSFIEGSHVRGIPPSPRAHRTPSFSQQALQDLINNPPVARTTSEEEKFVGRDWRTIRVGEVVVPEEVRFVQVDSSVEEATKVLITSGSPNVVLIREQVNTRIAVGAFDYDDLNAYLLLVTNLALPVEADEEDIEDVMSRARSNQSISLSDIKYLLGRKEPPKFLEHTDTLTRAVEIFGGGSHRIIVRKQGSREVMGVLSQLRLLRFFRDNITSFRAVDELHGRTLRDLDVGSHTVISINGDQPLKDALLLMHAEGITSLPVLDNHKNVIGNISHVDIKLLTTTASLPLLESTCTHFITVILSERGMFDGKDSYPVFHVTPYSTLAHTVAKLVATKSHRMWVVDAPSPAPSIPPSPSLQPSQPTTPAHPPPQLHQQHQQHHTQGPPYTPSNPSASISSSQLPGANLSGRLNGVVSLTDVLNLYGRASGLSPNDPDETRRRRRGSSSSSVRSRVGVEVVGGSGAGSAGQHHHHHQQHQNHQHQGQHQGQQGLASSVESLSLGPSATTGVPGGVTGGESRGGGGAMGTVVRERGSSELRRSSSQKRAGR